MTLHECIPKNRNREKCDKQKQRPSDTRHFGGYHSVEPLTLLLMATTLTKSNLAQVFSKSSRMPGAQCPDCKIDLTAAAKLIALRLAQMFTKPAVHAAAKISARLTARLAAQLETKGLSSSQTSVRKRSQPLLQD
jgi:hypothetical protein